jgi:beta-glucosidase
VYSDAKATPVADGGLDVSVRVKNTGEVGGDEVPQVYLDAPAMPPTGAQFAVQTLAAFDRVSLAPGETKEVVLHVPARSFEYWSTAENKWVRLAKRDVHIGSSSRDMQVDMHTP